MITNLLIAAQIIITTNTHGITHDVSPTERRAIVRVEEKRVLQFNLDGTNYEVPLSTNLLSETTTLRLREQWLPGEPEPRPAPQPPPMPPGFETNRVPRRSPAREAIPVALPSAEQLRLEKLNERLKLDKTRPDRRS